MILIYNYIVLWSQQVPAVAVLATLGTRACAAHPLGSHERRRVPPCRAGGSNRGGLVNVDRATVLTACSRQNSLNEARSSRDESLGRKGEGSGNLHPRARRFDRKPLWTASCGTYGSGHTTFLGTFANTARRGELCAIREPAIVVRNLEAPPGFEPGMEVLQTGPGRLCC
jgi:hypothetical protein